MNKTIIKKQYFDWMCGLITNGRTPYFTLLNYLYDKEFTYTIALDKNRAMDGIDLRYRFAGEDGYLINGPCCILEMMVALSLRCEEHIMTDDDAGNRTGKWFWDMCGNLGLHCMRDTTFDKVYCDKHIYNFLNREYKANGTGGLFTVNNRDEDLCNVEIWYQMCWYLDTII